MPDEQCYRMLEAHTPSTARQMQLSLPSTQEIDIVCLFSFTPPLHFNIFLLFLNTKILFFTFMLFILLQEIASGKKTNGKGKPHTKRNQDCEICRINGVITGIFVEVP